MPLVNTSPGVRLALRASVVFFAVIGLNYLHTDRALLRATPALRFADDHFPLPVSGFMFLACAVLIAVALVVKRSSKARGVASYALLVAMICQYIWSGVFLAAALQTNASPAACAWPAYVGTICLAVYLLLREV